MELNNPAARLLSILEEGLKQPDSIKNRVVWYQLLNVEKGDDATLMGRIG
jgi:hypothetical protein